MSSIFVKTAVILLITSTVVFEIPTNIFCNEYFYAFCIVPDLYFVILYIYMFLKQFSLMKLISKSVKQGTFGNVLILLLTVSDEGNYWICYSKEHELNFFSFEEIFQTAVLSVWFTERRCFCVNVLNLRKGRLIRAVENKQMQLKNVNYLFGLFP